MKNTRKFTFASDGTVATTLLWSSGLQVFKVLASLSFAILLKLLFPPNLTSGFVPKLSALYDPCDTAFLSRTNGPKKPIGIGIDLRGPVLAHSCQLGLQEICPCLANLS